MCVIIKRYTNLRLLGTARRCISVEMLSTAARVRKITHLECLAVRKWHWMSLKIIQIAAHWWARSLPISVVCGNIFHCFRDITTFCSVLDSPWHRLTRMVAPPNSKSVPVVSRRQGRRQAMSFGNQLGAVGHRIATLIDVFSHDRVV